MASLSGPARGPDGSGVELLERAIGYTRGALATLVPAHLCLPTPCEGWRLGDLLAHMEDSLDAFAEGADGAIGLRSAAPAPLEERLDTLRTKACALLGAWANATAPWVAVGGRTLAIETVTRVAALEVAVHGWDVGRTTGAGLPIPRRLADALLPTALAVVLDADGQFGPPLPVRPPTDPATHLLALLGRRAA